MGDLRTDRLWVLDTENGGERPATHAEAADEIARLRARIRAMGREGLLKSIEVLHAKVDIAQLQEECEAKGALISGMDRRMAELDVQNALLRAALEWLDRKGGLGLDVHERIRKALGKPEPY